MKTDHLFAFILLLILSATSTPQTANLSDSSVRLHVLVTDKANNPVADLNQDDFLVFEDGKPQIISSIQKDELPVSYGLIIDNTGSMRPSLTKVRQAATVIVKNNKPQDRTFIARLVDNKVLIPVDWTSEKSLLANSLSIMNEARGVMSIIDATYACSEYIAKHIGNKDTSSQRITLILITDGLEKDSSRKMDELLRQLHRNNVQVFAIGIMSFKDMPEGIFGRSVKERAMFFLDKLTEETGGRSLYPESNADLDRVAELVTRYMRSQYIIRYAPSGGTSRDGYRKVRVKLADKATLKKLTATTRLRYLVSARP